MPRHACGRADPGPPPASCRICLTQCKKYLTFIMLRILDTSGPLGEPGESSRRSHGHQEKRAWTRLVVSAVVYAVYVAVILNRADGHQLTATPYAAALLWTAGAGVVATMVIDMSLGMANPGGSRLKDARDREIGRVGDYTGQSFVIIGAT